MEEGFTHGSDSRKRPKMAKCFHGRGEVASVRVLESVSLESVRSGKGRCCSRGLLSSCSCLIAAGEGDLELKGSGLGRDIVTNRMQRSADELPAFDVGGQGPTLAVSGHFHRYKVLLLLCSTLGCEREKERCY